MIALGFSWAVCALIFLVPCNAQDVIPQEVLDFPTKRASTTTTVAYIPETTIISEISMNDITTQGPFLETSTTDKQQNEHIPTSSSLTTVMTTTRETITTEKPQTDISTSEMAQPATSTSIKPTSTSTTPRVIISVKPPCWNCYYKTQYGFPHLQWTYLGYKYIQTLDCYRCCRFAGSQFAGCTQVKESMCDPHLARTGRMIN